MSNITIEYACDFIEFMDMTTSVNSNYNTNYNKKRLFLD